MTMHRADVSIDHFAPRAAAAESNVRLEARDDGYVSEWADPVDPPTLHGTEASMDAMGFVDYDTVDSIHTPNRSSLPR